MTFLPNYYRSTLKEKLDVFEKEGWSFEILEKKAESTLVKVTQAPQVFNKSLQEEDFLFFVEKVYNESEDDNTLYSENERNAMASYACKNAFKVGDRLKSI